MGEHFITAYQSIFCHKAVSSCELSGFIHTWLEYDGIIIQRYFLCCSSADLYCQEKRQSNSSCCVQACTPNKQPRAQNHTTISIFLFEICKVKGWAVNVCALLVTVCCSSSIHLLPQSISSQSSEEQNLISTRGTELRDTETLSRCIYL